MNLNLPEAFSIIVLFHSGKEYLQTCLSSLVNTVRAQDEIIVFINNSDESQHQVDFFSERVTYIHIYENLGYSKAANVSIKYAKNDHLIFCDQDICFVKHWLIELWKSYTGKKNIGAAGIKLINHANNTILDFGIASSEFNFIHPNLGLSIHHPLVMKDREVQMVCSAVMLIHRDLLEKVGGFYEPFGTLYSDLDLCLKLKELGFNIIVSSKAMAYHFCGEYFSVIREYKNSYLKADIKGVFMKNNSHRIVNDVEDYFLKTYEHYHAAYGKLGRYFFCNMLSVANYQLYEDIMQLLGANVYDIYRKGNKQRDAFQIDLFSVLGINILNLGVPIAYFVDRFDSLNNNIFWLSRRKNINDIIIDRHANIVPLQNFRIDYAKDI